MISPLKHTHGNMKWNCGFLLAMGALLLTSCATTNFTEYRGSKIIQGTGGTIRQVDSIDIWENGDPDRKYKIIGVIDDARGGGRLAGNNDHDLAKVAREHDADAVIIADQHKELRGFDPNNGAARYTVKTKVLAIKYVP